MYDLMLEQIFSLITNILLVLAFLEASNLLFVFRTLSIFMSIYSLLICLFTTDIKLKQQKTNSLSLFT